MYHSVTSQKTTEQVSLTIERIYCTYCKSEIKIFSKKSKNKQICSSCDFILNNSDYLVFNLHPDLNVSDIEAIKLLELKLNSILPIVQLDNVNDISAKKFGIFIHDDKVIGLFLDNADLLSFPDEINYFSHLKVLSIANTKLKNLPETIGQLKELETLNIRDNNIEFLPESITTLQELKTIDMGQNQLRLLPDNFGELISLTCLNLENNLIYCLPKSFKSLKKLKFLNVFDNQIKLDLVVDLLPKNLINCGVGGNCLSKTSLKILKQFFKKKNVVQTKRKSMSSLQNCLQTFN